MARLRRDAEDQGGNLLELLMRARGVGFAETCRQAQEWLGWPTFDLGPRKIPGNGTNGKPAVTPGAFLWSDCVAALDSTHLSKLAEWRGLSPDFCQWLRDKELVGLHRGCFAFPVQGDDGRIIGCHFRQDNGSWPYDPPRLGVRPLTFGEPFADEIALVFEGQWDAFAAADKFEVHRAGENTGKLTFIVTRGVSNGALVRGCVPAGCSQVFSFPQNDEEKNGRRPGERWLEAVVANTEATIYRVQTPLEHKDINDWTRAGAAREEILAAMETSEAAPRRVVDLSAAPPPSNGNGSVPPKASPPAEVAELVELARAAFGAGMANSATSTNSSGDNAQPAVFPPDSILATWMKFACAQEEAPTPS